jgi:hypothetical protein
LNRRRFLVLTVTAGGSLLVQASLPGAELGWRGRQSTLSVKLTGLLEHQDSARIVGSEYLARYPQEADAHVLQERIVVGFAGGYGVLASANESTIRKLIGDRVRQDFETEQTVKLQGWILSVTEARLCALTLI